MRMKSYNYFHIHSVWNNTWIGGTRTNSASFFQVSQHGDDTALLFPNHLPKVADSAFQRTWGEGRYSNTCWQSTMSCFILLGWVKWAPLHMSAKLYFHPDIRMYIWIDVWYIRLTANLHLLAQKWKRPPIQQLSIGDSCFPQSLWHFCSGIHSH